jgi:hypothetical protein
MHLGFITVVVIAVILYLAAALAFSVPAVIRSEEKKSGNAAPSSTTAHRSIP